MLKLKHFKEDPVDMDIIADVKTHFGKNTVEVEKLKAQNSSLYNKLLRRAKYHKLNIHSYLYHFKLSDKTK